MTSPEEDRRIESLSRADAERGFAALAPQVSAKVRVRIRREGLAAWREQGLISAEQHDRLLTHVAAPPAASGLSAREEAAARERTLGRGVTLLINLGAIILAAGLIVFFASNWIE